jgi:hypothetical protein
MVCGLCRKWHSKLKALVILLVILASSGLDDELVPMSGGRAHGSNGLQANKRESILDLGKYIDQQINVKFNGGREGACSSGDGETPTHPPVVCGVLKGFDTLVNLVLDDAVEYIPGTRVVGGQTVCALRGSASSFWWHLSRHCCRLSVLMGLTSDVLQMTMPPVGLHSARSASWCAAATQ